MNTIHKSRLCWLALFASVIALALALVLYALKQNINLFYTPSQALTQHVPSEYLFRLGGMVKPSSVVKDKNNLQVQFILTDHQREIPVLYRGILPDLFREGSGAVAEGHLNAQGIFIADQVLAKHDEKYMPKAVYEAMRKGTLDPALKAARDDRGGERKA